MYLKYDKIYTTIEKIKYVYCWDSHAKLSRWKGVNFGK